MANVKRKIEFDFEEELARVRRRASKLEAAIRGSATVTTCDVKAHDVRAYRVRAHTRIVITVRK